MQRIHFKDDGQDILWWDIDDEGVVVDCNAQVWVWKDTKITGIKPVDFTDTSRPRLKFKKGDILIIRLPGRKFVTSFIHQVEKVEKVNAEKNLALKT